MAAVSEILLLLIKNCRSVHTSVCVRVCLFNTSQFPCCPAHRTNTHSFRSWILKSLFCFLRLPRNIFTDSHCSPTPNKMRNCVSEINSSSSTFFSAHCKPWRSLWCHPCPRVSPLLCAANRTTEAIFLVFFKQQQKKKWGRRRPMQLFPGYTHDRGEETPSRSHPSKSLPLRKQKASVQLGSVSWISPGVEHAIHQKIWGTRLIPKPCLKIVNLRFWEVRGRKGGCRNIWVKNTSHHQYIFCTRKIYFWLVIGLQVNSKIWKPVNNTCLINTIYLKQFYWSRDILQG